jgi:REP element-mobilizing transposase RayT
MIIAYHTIFATYGTWLPNDPRGSYSKVVYSDAIRTLGSVRYGQQDTQSDPDFKNTLRQFWTASRGVTNRRQFFIDDSMRQTIAAGFARATEQLDLTVYACAIMNDHVHLLSARNRLRIEYISGKFKSEASRELGLTKTPWAKNAWKVFLHDPETIISAAHYINMNPIKAGWEPQHWDFVTPFQHPNNANHPA